jgi:hypothetical protein
MDETIDREGLIMTDFRAFVLCLQLVLLLNLSVTVLAAKKSDGDEASDREKPEKNEYSQEEKNFPAKPNVRAPICKKKIGELHPPAAKPLSSNSSKRKGEGPEHGPDPHDEVHDDDLPAHTWGREIHPSKDPYNGTTGNNRNDPFKPY